MYRIGIDVGGTFTDMVSVDDAGRVALAKAASTPGDPSLGVMDGIAALGHLRADSKTKAIPVIGVTASAMPHDRQKIMSAGFDGSQSKPINVKEFLVAVREGLLEKPLGALAGERGQEGLAFRQSVREIPHGQGALRRAAGRVYLLCVGVHRVGQSARGFGHLRGDRV